MAYRHPRLPRKPEPHIALWMLRLLASPTGLPLFATKGGFASDRLAYALDLDHWIDPQERTFDLQAVRGELYDLLARAERTAAHTPLPAPLARIMAEVVKSLAHWREAPLGKQDIDGLKLFCLVSALTGHGRQQSF